MAWSDSSRDSSDSAHSLSSGVFSAAGVQVKAMAGSSFTTDVIRVERLGVESAVKILTPNATKDPDLVSRFLKNARYNQSLNEFTGMRITEIVETGPRPYYVMEKVAESSLLEIIRQHAPLDPRWLATLLLPIARMLDTIHQRSVLHANIKPSNLLVVVENNQEKFLLVDYMEPTLAATSATLTGAGVYAAPEFRAGTPVSNRSDIYSLSAVMYEALSGIVPGSSYRGADGVFHVWRAGDRPRELCQVNPEINRTVSEMIMHGVSPDAISRPASATALVEETLRTLEVPRTRVEVKKEVEPDHQPVPMLLIAAGVFLTILLLFGGYKLLTGAVGGSDTPQATSTSAQTTTTENTAVTNLTANEQKIIALLPSVDGNQTCPPSASTRNNPQWALSIAELECTSDGVTDLRYGLFSNSTDQKANYQGQALTMSDEVQAAGGKIVGNTGGKIPCSTNQNESGGWGDNEQTGKIGGQYTCVSLPHPRIVWTDTRSGLIGDAELRNGNIADLIQWWSSKGGPIG